MLPMLQDCFYSFRSLNHGAATDGGRVPAHPAADLPPAVRHRARLSGVRQQGLALLHPAEYLGERLHCKAGIITKNTFEIIDFLLKGNKIRVGFLHANNQYKGQQSQNIVHEM